MQRRSLLSLTQPYESVHMIPRKTHNGAATTPTPKYRRPIRARMGAKDSRMKAAITDRAVRASVHRTALFSPARHATQLSLRL